MTKILKLYNTFTRSLNEVRLNGKLVTTSLDTQKPPSHGSLYICGPTVYSDSHVGHAITYIRSDLLRRCLKYAFNVRLQTVMNITDIDDKILEKTRIEFGQEHGENFSSQPSEHPFKRISDRYYSSFLQDLASIRVLPADLYVKVSDSINLITDFIRKLERNGHTYITPNGDVNFRVQSVKNYSGRVDSRKELPIDTIKQDPRDFVLWKASKPNEPVWFYESSNNGACIPGRPGWHVQCSAISSAIFGKKLDFHFGGKDLIFPHHYNEEACCCAYHSLDTSETLHVWSQNWLHSGHLISKDAKMSKSLGNVVAINNFIGRSSLNSLRLLCIHSHYRSDIEFNDELMDKLKATDHKLNAFISYISARLRDISSNLTASQEDQSTLDSELEHSIVATHESIIDGICDDLHLDYGLDSILALSKTVYSRDVNTLRIRDLISCWTLIKDWCQACGLEYGETDAFISDNARLLDLLNEFRQKVRTSVVGEIRKGKGGESPLHNILLQECDNVRAKLDELGFVVRDRKV